MLDVLLNRGVFLTPGYEVFPTFVKSPSPYNKSKKKREWRVRASRNEEDNGGGGDARTQELLAFIATVEVKKMKVTELVKEQSDHLIQMGEQTDSELQQLVQNTKNDMEQAGIKVLKNVEAEVEACEKQFAAEWAELSENKQDADDFEAKMQKERNDGLFFKKLYSSTKKWKDLTPERMYAAQLEANKVEEVTNNAFGMKIRKSIYVFFIIVLSLVLSDIVSLENKDWTKLAIYSLLLLVIVAQLIYESATSSGSNEFKDK